MDKYETKVSTEGQNHYLDFLIDPSFQGVNNVLFYSLKMRVIDKLHTRYYSPKDWLIDGKNVFDQPVKSDVRTYDNI